MPKGYWIAHVSVTDPETYPDYITTAKPAFEKYSARFLARGGAYECLEGDTGERHVIIEFASMADALACYSSETYQKGAKIRQSASTGSFTIVEGAE